MKKTRVEKFSEYREEIEKMNFDEMSPSEKEEIERKNKNLSTSTVQDLMERYDEYTVLIDSTEVAERNLLAERRKKQLRNHKIKLICVYVALGIIAVALVLGIIFLIVSGIK